MQSTEKFSLSFSERNFIFMKCAHMQFLNLDCNVRTRLKACYVILPNLTFERQNDLIFKVNQKQIKTLMKTIKTLQ